MFNNLTNLRTPIDIIKQYIDLEKLFAVSSKKKRTK